MRAALFGVAGVVRAGVLVVAVNGLAVFRDTEVLRLGRGRRRGLFALPELVAAPCGDRKKTCRDNRRGRGVEARLHGVSF